MEIWPNFFIVGAAKAGTTSLYEYLRHTRGVYMSPEKEPGYFRTTIPDRRKTNKINEKSQYLKLFKGVTDEKAIGEATPSYLRDPLSHKLIQEAVPKARIIIILRDPVERAFSAYLMRESKGWVEKSFHETIIDGLSQKKKEPKDFNFFLDPGLYTQNVKKYIDTFGPDRVKILIFEEFIKDPKKTIKEVLEFLGVDAEPPETIGKIHNPYGKPRGRLAKEILGSKTMLELSNKIVPQSIRWKIRGKILLKKEPKPKLSGEDRLILQDFYKNDIIDIQVLLKRSLPWD